MENELDPHVWQAAADVIVKRIAQNRSADGEPRVTERDAALAAWIIGELHKFGFIKDPNA